MEDIEEFTKGQQNYRYSRFSKIYRKRLEQNKKLIYFYRRTFRHTKLSNIEILHRYYPNTKQPHLSVVFE